MSARWSSISESVMTSMVVSLAFIKISTELFHRHFRFLEHSHIHQLLQALEQSHWHARSFNEDKRVRSSLREQKFMSPFRSPNLLEQEVSSVTQIIEMATSLFCGESEAALLAEPWVKRYCVIVCTRFMDLDDTLATDSPVPAELVAAYKPAGNY